MLQYLIILLDDSSTSYCYYESGSAHQHLIDLSDLKAGIKFAMKENLMIQFVYPATDIPTDYKQEIETIDHSKIIPATSPLVDEADVVVFNNLQELSESTLESTSTCVLRINKDVLFNQKNILAKHISKYARLNMVVTDLESFTDNDYKKYEEVISTLGEEVARLFKEDQMPQLNIITDRLALTQMNNCNAGCNNITLAPDGKFYICPAFYYSAEDKGAFCVGNLQNGLSIKAAHLYKLPYAPLCRNCDAFQCKRCVWLNRRMTYDITTPSHEQCVLAHIERNESRKVLATVRKEKTFYPGQNIKELDYLDPFDVRIDWHKI